MSDFRFAIMGAGKIARRFCDAVERTEECCVSAVASKSIQRAQALCREKGIPSAWEGYREMLEKEKPDGVYIAATSDAHFELASLCAQSGVPVLCEKSMFTSFREAEAFFRLAREKKVFAMEALWSRFLPVNQTAKRWIREGRIGRVLFGEMHIGFEAPHDTENRYFNPHLGGGAANDLTVYGFQILPWMMGLPVKRFHAEAMPASTGVDAESTVLLRLEEDVRAVIHSSLLCQAEEKLLIQGTEGRIVIPHAHWAQEAMLLDKSGQETDRFRDEDTLKGFVGEIREVMRCVSAGLTESPVVPWKDVLLFGEVQDGIRSSMTEAEA